MSKEEIVKELEAMAEQWAINVSAYRAKFKKRDQLESYYKGCAKEGDNCLYDLEQLLTKIKNS